MFQMALLFFKENNCAKLFWNPCINVEVVARTSSIYDHFIIWTSSVALTFNLPEQIFQMALLLFKENNCAQLFWNPCINVEVMARTSSIYDHFMIWPSNVTLTFNLPKIKALQALHDAQPLRLHQARWPSLIFARRPVMLYICTKFCETIWNDIKVIEWTWFL